VFERDRVGNEDRVRDARRRDDIAVAVGRDGLDRRRPDVDADRRLGGDGSFLPGKLTGASGKFGAYADV
jgi:hypothetical protein